MDILKEYFPDEDHVFVYDNARTHLKRPETAISAIKMPKNPSPTFGIDIVDIDANGKLKYGTDGKVVKKRIKMADGLFEDG